MKTNQIWFCIASAIALMTCVACGDAQDRNVYVHDGVGTGGSDSDSDDTVDAAGGSAGSKNTSDSAGGNAGAAGSAGTGGYAGAAGSAGTGGYAGAAGSAGNGTGGTGGVAVSTSVDFYSFDVHSYDAFKTAQWAVNKTDEFYACIYDTVCKAKAMANAPNRPFEFLQSGQQYSESYPNMDKGFAVELGWVVLGQEIVIHSGGMLWGEVKLSNGSSQPFNGSSGITTIKFDPGDEGSKCSVLFVADNSVTITFTQ